MPHPCARCAAAAKLHANPEQKGAERRRKAKGGNGPIDRPAKAAAPKIAGTVGYPFIGNLGTTDRIQHFQDYAVVDPGDTPLRQCQLLTEDEKNEAENKYGVGSFEAEMGANAVKKMLMRGVAGRCLQLFSLTRPVRRQIEDAGRHAIALLEAAREIGRG